MFAQRLFDRGTIGCWRGLFVAVDAEWEYRQFVLEVATRLFRTAFMLTNDRQLAEDLVQQTLLRAWRYWRHVREADDRYSYVRRILLNSHSRMHRRRRVSEVLTAAPHEQEGHRPLVDERDQLLRAIDHLSYGQKAVLLLRFYEDLTVDQTAELLGCSVGTVKSRTARALQQLRMSPHLDPHEGR